MLDQNTRYLQIAFNHDLGLIEDLLPEIPVSDRIMIEAGTPFIKRHGAAGIARITQLWGGRVVADLKTADGALGEVALARSSGATAATVLGSAPPETLTAFCRACADQEIDAMIDMLGIADPLAVLRNIRVPPAVVILHRGRDEESAGKATIDYKQVNRIRSKFDVLISAAGGIGLKEARSAIFNGANIVIVNLARPGDTWKGMSTDGDIGAMAEEFLKTIE